MIKLLKLIDVNVRGLFDYNRVKMAKEYHLRDSTEVKMVIISIILLLYGYIMYFFTNNLLSLHKNYILLLGYIITYIMLLIYDLIDLKNGLFTATDNDFLFSLPLKNSQIILSKLFNTYIKNIIISFVVMFPMYYALIKMMPIVDVVSFTYLLLGFTLPLIPIVIGTIYAYIDTYYNLTKYKKIYLIIKLLIIIAILFIIYLLFNNIKLSNMNILIKRLYIINPLLFILKLIIINKIYLLIPVVVGIPIILFIIFVKYLSFNYTHLISYLKGVHIKEDRKVVVSKKKTKLHSMISKEFKTLINNRLYFRNTYLIGIILTVVYFIVSLFMHSNNIVNKRFFYIFLMIILSFIAGLVNSTIHSISLEKEYIINYKCLPVRFYKVLLSKWLLNILIVLPIIIINVITTILFYNFKWYLLLLLFINPLLVVMFNSLFGLVLDYRFINFNNKDEVYIIKSRIISYMPKALLLLVCIMMYYMTLVDNILIITLTFSMINIIGFLITLFYLIISYKKIYKERIK